jgi:hypothetical protein
VAGGCAVSSRRAAEAIVAAARLDQLDPDHTARAAVREAFSRRALEPADAPV